MTKIEKKMVGVTVVFVGLIIICWCVALKSCNKVLNEVESKGLKSVVEKIWEGKKVSNKHIEPTQ